MFALRFIVLLVLLTFSTVEVQAEQTAKSPEWIATGQTAMVASDHPLASQVGLDIIRSGGNAVDAAVAVSFALAVTRPQSTGLGGGGFMIVRLASTGEVFAFDYRETAPQKSSADMYDRFVKAHPDKTPPSRFGQLAVAVPGQVAGLATVLKRFGRKPISELVAPAIELANDGFPVDNHYVSVTESVLKKYSTYPELRKTCPYVYDVHLRKGDLRKPGEILRQPALARLLEVVGREGAKGFYSGPVAKAIVNEIGGHGGIITEKDLAGYKVAPRTPLKSTYRGYEIIAMPPPSSGGTCVIETLNILETVDLPAIYKTDSALAYHYFIEAMKHAFADRARWQADADYTFVPTGLLTSKVYAWQLAGSLDQKSTAESDTYGTLQIPNDSGTSHFCIVDSQGNVVVSTETINTSFGSLAAVSEWGLILNNEMDDFSARPGKVNAYRLSQSDRNAVEPGKRPLSSMSPTIVCKDGRPFLLLGGSGGPRIITSVLNVLVGVLDFGRSLEEAIAAPRVHHQWKPDEIRFDRDPDLQLIHGLRQRGHQIRDQHTTGIVQAIHFDGKRLIGASDPRKEGQPRGY